MSSFDFDILKSDIEQSIDAMVDEWEGQQADWGLSDDSPTFDAINALTIWNDVAEYGTLWNEAQQAIKNSQNPSQLVYPRDFEKPEEPAEVFTYSISGSQLSQQPVYAIDGSDQVAYEFTQARKGGAGIATYGWIATFDDRIVEKCPGHHKLQIVPADVRDVVRFSLMNFGEYPKLNPDSLRVRNYAALRRTQLEFLQLSNLVDVVQPGSIILLDGFLKAMFSPPVHFIHAIGKKAARKGVILVGVAKSSKIEMWLHFEEYWRARNSNICWIRPPGPILDRAYPSYDGDDSNQFLYLGERGRGIGIPVAASLSNMRRSHYMFDFNCYDFEASANYLQSAHLPEVHAKYFPFTSRDKEFIDFVLAQIAYYAERIICLGYPFPTAAAHGLVKIRQHDVRKVRSIARSELLRRGISLERMSEFQEDPHKIVDSF